MQLLQSPGEGLLPEALGANSPDSPSFPTSPIPYLGFLKVHGPGSASVWRVVFFPQLVRRGGRETLSRCLWVPGSASGIETLGCPNVAQTLRPRSELDEGGCWHRDLLDLGGRKATWYTLRSLTK